MLYRYSFANNSYYLSRLPIPFQVYPTFQQQSQKTRGLRELQSTVPMYYAAITRRSRPEQMRHNPRP